MMRHPLAIFGRNTYDVVMLAVTLAAAILIILLPDHRTAPIKAAVLASLRPGQQAASSLRCQTAQLIEGVRAYMNTTAKLTAAQQELRRLQSKNRRLADQLAQARRSTPPSTANADDEGANPLLRTRCIPANVLGHQARAYLVRHELLDVGAATGAEPDALVLDAPSALVDHGSDAAVKAGRLVLSGGQVWGKVIQVGVQISLVQTVTSAGYRDLVRLGSVAAPRAGPEGILEGTGQPLARIRSVEVTEPVAVGDRVWTAAGPGVFLSNAFLYGQVVRVERPAGAAHWDIWMKPAVDSSRVEEVFILQPELNPSRAQQK